MMFIRVIFLCLLMTKGFSLEYAITAKREKNPKIREIKVFSERCSGSTFFEVLMIKNLRVPKKNRVDNNRRVISSGKFSHKHFCPWFSLPIEDFHGPKDHYTFEGQENTLFLVIFRNPYDWLRSFHTMPWHVATRMAQLPFKKFIRATYEINEADPILSPIRQYSPYQELDPSDKKSFANVIKLRTEKIKNMLIMQKLANNIYYVNYETVRKNPEKVMREVADYFGLNVRKKFRKITEYKGNKYEGTYKRKKYPELDPEDILYINSQLDEEIENSIGYELRSG